MINTLTYQEPQQQSKQDKILRGFFKVKARFADIINAMLFEGKDVVNVNINFTKNVSLSFTSFGCFAHLPLSLISCLLFYRTFL